MILKGSPDWVHGLNHQFKTYRWTELLLHHLFVPHRIFLIYKNDSTSYRIWPQTSDQDQQKVRKVFSEVMKCCATQGFPLVATEENSDFKDASILKPRIHTLHHLRFQFLLNMNYILWGCKTWDVINQWVGLQRLHPSFIYSVWHAHFALYSVWLWKRNHDWNLNNLSTPSQSSDFTCHLCIFIKLCLCLWSV